MKKRQHGVTIVEMGIVLAVIGLLLGGALKGQELLNVAKVRAIADRQASVQTAWHAFYDRFKAMPGDYINAEHSIPGAGVAYPALGDGQIEVDESIIAYQHLAGSGMLRCQNCIATGTADPTKDNSPLNTYGGVMAIYHSEDNYAARGAGTPNARLRLLSHTGASIPSNIMAEIDRKLDDGFANTGNFVASIFVPTTGPTPRPVAPTAGDCLADEAFPDTSGKSSGGGLNETDVIAWRTVLARPPLEQNCGGALHL